LIRAWEDCREFFVKRQAGMTNGCGPPDPSGRFGKAVFQDD